MVRKAFQHVGRRVVRPVPIQSRLHRRRFVAAGLTEQFIDVEGGRIRFWKGGKGPLLLLIHGFGADATWQWSGQVRTLSRHHTLLVPDLPGFGASHFHGHPPTLNNQVNAMFSLLESHPVCDVVGISYGGFVALRMVECAPERFRRLVIMACPGRTYTGDDYAALLKRYDIAHIVDLLLPKQPENVRRLLALAWHRPPWVPKWALPSVHSDLFLDQVHAKNALLHDLVSHLKTPLPPPDEPFRTPSMVIWGAHDPLFPVALAHRLADSIHAELRILPRAAHAPNLEHPRQINRLIRRFLASA